MKYDSVISVGGNCEVAHNLREFTGSTSAHVFDWWVAPFPGVIDLLDSNFTGLFESSNMEIMGDRKAVRCKRYGIIHHHDFKRDENKRVIVEEVEEQLPKLTAKYAALLSRLLGACSDGRRVLLIRSWREIIHEPKGYPKQLIPGVPIYDFSGFVDAFRRRFPDANISVLFVNYGGQRVDIDEVYFDNIKDYGDTPGWQGSALGWRELLNRHVTI